MVDVFSKTLGVGVRTMYIFVLSIYNLLSKNMREVEEKLNKGTKVIFLLPVASF